MRKRPRGRPRVYNVNLIQILEALRRNERMDAAAEELGSSVGLIYYRLNQVGLTPWEVLRAGSIEELVKGRDLR